MRRGASVQAAPAAWTIRNLVRSWWNHTPVPAPSRDHAAWRRAQLAADAASWAKQEAAAQKRAKFEQAVADEVLRVQLERGSLGFD
jgi:hypothetical protein